MPAALSSIVTGITAAVISAARTLPSMRNSTATTSSAPSARFVATVLTVLSTSTPRSSTDLASMPGGSVRATSARRLSTAAATVRLLPPISISAVPTTTSCPFSLALPMRGAWPACTRATSRSRMGTPSRVATTTCSISATVESRPGERTTSPSPPRST